MSQDAAFRITNASYLATAVKEEQYPAGEMREIAFIGRSNVGKSSLINSLARHGGLARVSGTPGKTQTINFYRLTAKYGEEAKTEFSLVDLPGYGYARTGRSQRSQWSKFIEEYFLQSKRLILICLLIDSRHPAQESDILSYRWLTEHNLPVQVIATKSDKLSKMNIRKNLEGIRQQLGGSQRIILPYSASSGAGREELLAVIGEELKHAESV